MTEIFREARVSTDLIAALSSIRRALRRKTGRAGGISDLTDAQRELVRVARRNPGIRIGEAATELQLAGNTVSTLLSSLVAAGWLEREPDAADARSARISLTPKAQSRVAEWRDRRESVLEEAVSRLEPDERERIEHAIPALQKIVANLQEQS